MSTDEFTRLSGAVALLVSAVIHTVQVVKAAKLKKANTALAVTAIGLAKRLATHEPPKAG